MALCSCCRSGRRRHLGYLLRVHPKRCRPRHRCSLACAAFDSVHEGVCLCSAVAVGALRHQHSHRSERACAGLQQEACIVLLHHPSLSGHVHVVVRTREKAQNILVQQECNVCGPAFLQLFVTTAHARVICDDDCSFIFSSRVRMCLHINRHVSHGSSMHCARWYSERAAPSLLCTCP